MKTALLTALALAAVLSAGMLSASHGFSPHGSDVRVPHDPGAPRDPNDPNDCNNNGNPDNQDITDCTSPDCNGNGIPDECDIAADPGIDSDGDGIPDSCTVITEYVQIDPRATYLRTEADPNATDARPVDLEALGILPGALLRLERLGDFGSTIGRDDGEYNEDMVVVFSATDVLLPSDQLDRVQDAVVAGDAYTTPNTWIGDLPTDIAADFYVYRVTLCVPDGARFLFVSGVDSFFGDNFDANHDFTLRITALPGFADCNHNGVPDDEDISSGLSSDINGNGVPDECETVAFDAIAVELTVHNDLSSLQMDGDAVAVELTLHNDLSQATENADAIAVEFTFHNDLTTRQLGSDAVAREFTVCVCLLGDLNGDGCVDLSDLGTLVANYEGPGPMAYEDGDLDGDGDVDLADLAILVSHYGDGCG